MNTLFVGSTQATSTSLYYFTSLVQLGHNVLPWDPGYFETANAVERAVQRLNRGPSPWKVRKINRTLIRLCQQNAFDLVFVMGENFLTHEAIEEIRASAPHTPRFLFHSHDNVFSEGILKPAEFFQTLAAYDIVFTTKSQNVKRYEQLGQKQAHFIPSAYEPMVHRPIPQSQSCLIRDFDVSFIGTFDGSRLPILEKAGWDRLHVWGNGWKNFKDFKQHAHRIHPYAIYHFEFADICSRTKCSLGLLREEAEDLHTQRTFELPACGTLQLAPRNDEIQTFFKEDEEIVLFSSNEELKEKLDYYLSNDADRSRIAHKGHDRCVQGKNTYRDRVTAMLALLD